MGKVWESAVATAPNTPKMQLFSICLKIPRGGGECSVSPAQTPPSTGCSFPGGLHLGNSFLPLCYKVWLCPRLSLHAAEEESVCVCENGDSLCLFVGRATNALSVEAPGGKTSWVCVGEELTAGEGGKERLEFPAGMTMELCHKDGGTCPGAAARVMV